VGRGVMRYVLEYVSRTKIEVLVANPLTPYVVKMGLPKYALILNLMTRYLYLK
jgi:hypothetical protein